MFGGGNFTSSWANPQQNQQQQPQQGTSAFGQPSAFGGTGTTFGSGSTFGQPPQQQPQANPMFGNLGAPSNNGTGASTFGTFGSNPSSTTGSLFAPKPATGAFGTFSGGGTSTFGGGSTFGSSTSAPSTQPTTSIFGAPSTSTNTGTGTAFGSTGGLFGTKPATAFGAGTLGSTTSTDGVAPVTTGTVNPPYSVYTEKDGTQTNQFQAISCMPAYRGTSFEELRVQDYLQGRKTGSTGAFGQPTTFGAPQPSATGGGLFGATQPTSTLGAPAPAGGSLFGGTTNAGTTGSGLFGSFGQPQQQQQPAATGSGLFGNTGGSLFGAPQQNQPAATTGGGLFSGLGGQQQQQNKPTFGTFGGTGTTFGSTFGQPSQQQPQQPQQPATGGGLFGNAGGSLFGGQNNAPKPGGLFGSTTTQPTQPSTTFGGGLFGNTQQQQQQQQQQPQLQQQPGGGLFGGSLFGQNNQQQPQQQPQQQQSGGLFGNLQPQQQQQQQQQPGGGLFGNTGTGGGGLFGNTQSNQQQQQQQQQQQSQQQQQPGGGLFGGSLFGPKPATTTVGTGGGLFGNFGQQNTGGTAGQTNPLFGNTQNNTNQQPGAGGGLFGGGGGLFGNKPTAPTLGASTMQQPAALGGSLFGNMSTNNNMNASTAAPGAPGSLTASVAQPVSAHLPIFNLLPPGPRSFYLDEPKKKVNLFELPHHRYTGPDLRLNRRSTGGAQKLRGFQSTLGRSEFGKSGAIDLNKAAQSVGPDALLNNGPASVLGSSGRQSVKKLVLNRRVDPSEFFNKTITPGKGFLGSPNKVTFSPQLTIAMREQEHSEAASSPRRPGSPVRNARSSPDKYDEPELQEGDYYTKPPLQELRSLSYEELVSFEGLVVGRKGYGEIQFLEKVDLTGLPKLKCLLGDVIRFEDKECTVYPDHPKIDKPPPGQGLNVKARIELVKCWAVDKANREPIKDPEHPAAVKHLKRLQKMKGTHFEKFDMEDGRWVFTVDSF